jgi:hypothetical protein
MHGRGFWAVAAACLALTAMAISGCGSSDSGSTAAATSESAGSGPLTKKEFVAQANQICQEHLKEKDKAVTTALKELPRQAVQNPNSKALAIFVEQTVIPPYEELIEQLGQLNAPQGEEAAVGKIMTKYEASMKLIEAQPAKAVTKNPFVSADEAAEAYGLESCRL